MTATAPARVPAVVSRAGGPLSTPGALVDAEVDRPVLGPHDLLVRVEAVSVNPVDVKVRAGGRPGPEGKVLGYDASGVVEEVGPEVTLFAPGDEVWYAGAIDRPGTNSALHAVDERIVGRKPANLTHAEAAAMPLTTITAWESLFDRLGLGPESTGTILVLAAAGGVGSMVVQLAKRLTRLTVIGTASRPESAAWARELGADHVVDHSGDLAAAVLEVAPDGVQHVFSSSSPRNIEAFARVLTPFGHVVAIDDDPADLTPLKPKSIAWHWELMFTRSLFTTPDVAEQHRLLDQVATMVEAGELRTTATTVLTGLDAATLTEAHRLVETGRTVGKVVVTR